MARNFDCRIHITRNKSRMFPSVYKYMPLRNGESKCLVLFSLPLGREKSVFRLCVVCSLFMAIIFLRFSSIVACCALCLFSGCCHKYHSPVLPSPLIDFLAQFLHFSVKCSSPIFLFFFFPLPNYFRSVIRMKQLCCSLELCVYVFVTHISVCKYTLRY